MPRSARPAPTSYAASSRPGSVPGDDAQKTATRRSSDDMAASLARYPLAPGGPGTADFVIMTGPADPWDIERLDLDGYLKRVGVAAGKPSRALLDELHEAHVRTFTFDNID